MTRRLAAELEVDALEGLGRGLRDLLARRDVAGQRDQADVRMPDDPGADRLPVPGDDVEDPARDHVRRQLGESRRGERRLLGGLQDGDVARRQRRANFQTAIVSG